MKILALGLGLQIGNMMAIGKLVMFKTVLTKEIIHRQLLGLVGLPK
jgi:hypothetical protein